MSDFANPLPPPPRKGGAVDVPQTPGGRPLSNKDFKLLIATPRPGGRSQLHNLSSGGKIHLQADRADETPKQAQKAKKKPFRPKKETEANEEDNDAPKYRDRAKERREGRLIDYENANADLAVLMEGQEMDVSKISVEDSKYLGGDVEHTHLVKGLDYALLNKMRGENEKTMQEQAEEMPEGGEKPSLRFVTPMGRAVYRAIMEPPKADAVESFLPGRMAFIYSFEEDEFGNPPSDVPTTLRRSKADCPKLPPMMQGGVDKALLERIATVMSYVQLAPGGKKTKIKKKDRAKLLGDFGAESAVNSSGSLRAKDQQPRMTGMPTVQHKPASAPANGEANAADEDDDIFDDAGKDYVCDLGRKGSSARDRDTSGGYFDNADDMDDLPPLQGPARPPAGSQWLQDGVHMEGDDEYGSEPPPPPPPPTGQEASWRQSQGQEQRQGRADKPELKGFAEDAYAECYPEYHDMAAEIVDSDDEGTIAEKMDLGRQGKVKTRYDFSTEEEYTQYKHSQEANPKAAFQFGLKREGGRKASAALGKKNPDSRVNSELSKIKNILKDKGHSRDMVAFEAGPKEQTGGPTKRRKRL
mmetsp:Transcript_36029/g.85486  ORF Transcript_36029/g.85486 Transcript_36029/m.85486 type:complete len:584 (-) Transcript_36029:57-1808(-)|eukprot:CAMPEP_0177582002 /NCGR_PEP_ID=MMETSP0419_2-20121207/2471_1 /TAXON_ID=582737 /ORGANISM="Tetraselmis sp., Strain GSL018" /LENGTH=583 /DNA_ID=CAMNT_0019071127 /DNA_START=125 /DNA_END=1876 /DNA_ORIENTATION=+